MEGMHDDGATTAAKMRPIAWPGKAARPRAAAHPRTAGGLRPPVPAVMAAVVPAPAHSVTRWAAVMLTAMLCLCAFLAAPVSSHASSPASADAGNAAAIDTTAIDATAVNGSITIDAAWDRASDAPLALAGDTYAIVRVATATLASSGDASGDAAGDGGSADAAPTVTAFHTVDAFARFGDEWTGLSASQLNQRAKDMADYAGAHGLYDADATTGAAGMATFRGLDAGVYLVARTAVAKANARYACDPFLVSVPGGLGDETPTLAVTVEPKFADTGEPTRPGTPGEPTVTPVPLPTPASTANTGADVALIAALAMVALAVGVGAFVWRRRMRR